MICKYDPLLQEMYVNRLRERSNAMVLVLSRYTSFNLTCILSKRNGHECIYITHNTSSPFQKAKETITRGGRMLQTTCDDQ